MTMTVDEALKMFAESGPHHWDGMYDVAQALAAEIERLQKVVADQTAELESWRETQHGLKLHDIGELRAENVRLQAVIADQALTIGALKDENSKALDERDRWKLLYDAITIGKATGISSNEAALKLLGLREEAQTARLALDVALKAHDKLEGQLQSLWQAIDDAMAFGEGPVRWSALERIESEAYKIRSGQHDENPAPGAAT